MSLVGSLEDLALGDILQIVSLSRKSGFLLLRSEAGEGRIVLCDGKVRGASVKGEPEDLRGLLVGVGAISPVDFELASNAARRAGTSIEAALSERTGLTPERIDTLRREHVERVALCMFSWHSGEFSFEVREQLDDAADLLLPVGINAQYLTLEATRVGDESGPSRFRGIDAEAPGTGDVEERGDGEEDGSPEPIFSGEDAYREHRDEPSVESAPAPFPDGGFADAHEAVALAAARQVEVALGVEELERGTELPSPVPEVPAAGGEAAEALLPAKAATPQETPPERAPGAHLVVVDPDLAALEWLKRVLRGEFARIHIFQHAAAGLYRIRQYLGRGHLPLVLLSARASVDRATGARDLAGLVQRLKQQAPPMPLVILRDHSALAVEGLAAADAVVDRPLTARIAGGRATGQLEAAASELREALRPWADACLRSRERRAAADAEAGDKDRPGPSPDPDLLRLKRMSERMRDPESRGDVLALALEFASESFARVAMFMLREDEVVGLAQRGLPAAGGLDDAAFCALRLRADAVPWLRDAVETRRAQRVHPRGASSAGPSPAGAGSWPLGGRPPREAYLAPIESGGTVVALLYADQLPRDTPIPDTTLIEVVLGEAGMALDRALLERALVEVARQNEAL